MAKQSNKAAAEVPVPTPDEWRDSIEAKMRESLGMPAPDPLPRQALVEAPLGEVGEGYLSAHLQARLTSIPQRRAMRALTVGLVGAGERTDDGRPVRNATDAIRWLLERLAASL